MKGEPHGTAQGHQRPGIIPRHLQDGSVRMDHPSRERWGACRRQHDRPQQRGRTAVALAGSRRRHQGLHPRRYCLGRSDRRRPHRHPDQVAIRRQADELRAARQRESVHHRQARGLTATPQRRENIMARITGYAAISRLNDLNLKGWTLIEHLVGAGNAVGVIEWNNFDNSHPPVFQVHWSTGAQKVEEPTIAFYLGEAWTVEIVDDRVVFLTKKSSGMKPAIYAPPNEADMYTFIRTA